MKCSLASRWWGWSGGCRVRRPQAKFWQLLCWVGRSVLLILYPLLKTGAHHSYTLGCRRINEITHGTQPGAG